MISQVPQDEKARQAIVDVASKRYKRASSLSQPYRETWVRLYKIWAKMQDAVEEEESQDEPNTFLSYAFSIVEQLAAGVVESYFKIMPPCNPRPRKKGQQKQAENFATMARNYYSGAPYQQEFVASIKEWVITGNRWEFDEWAEEYEEGTRWAKQMVKGVMDTMKSLMGKILPLKDAPEVEHQAEVEVPHLYPLRLGYQTRFPTVFDVLPEDPRKRRLEDQAYIILEETGVLLSDLEKQFYTDPVSKQKVPVFDLEELKRVLEPGKKTVKPENPWRGEGDDYKAEIQERRQDSNQEDGGSEGEDDIPRLWLVHIFEKNKVVTIAQGQFVIRVCEKYLHKPRFTFRLNVYTVDPYSFFGLGALQPVEDELLEMNDIHNMSLMEWLRGIHRMVAYTENTVPFADDWKPRAGGKIRVRTDMPIRDVLLPIEQSSHAESMFAMESNLKGLVEKATAAPDFSPGAEGTKQWHKTATGLMEISRDLAVRQAAMVRALLTNAQRQMESMEAFISQYQFDPAPYRQYRNDGSTMMVELSKDDIDTEGVGFDYAIEIDPSVGDDAVARQHSIYLVDLGIKYETFRKTMGDPKMEKLDVTELLRNTITKFGYADTSRLIKQPDGTITPSDEFEILLNGGSVATNEKDDHIGHLLEHIIQRDSPVWQQGIASGKVSPEAAQALDLHIQETVARIQGVMQDPRMAAQEKLNATLHMGGGPRAMPQTKGPMMPGPMGGGMQPAGGMGA